MNVEEQFITYTKNGYYCAAGDFYLDPRKPVATAIISHAHADHAVPGNGTVYCTLPTKAFMEYRYQHKAAVIFKLCAYGETIEIKGVKITFFPAGHILGSAQILMEYKGLRYLYTGD